MAREAPRVVDHGELDQLELSEVLENGDRIVDAVRVEAHARPADGTGEEQVPAGRDDALSSAIALSEPAGSSGSP